MNTEKMLIYINEAINKLDEEEKKYFEMAREMPIKTTISEYSIGAILAEMAKEAERDIAEKEAKKNNTKAQYKALERIWQAAVDNNLEQRRYIAGTFENAGYRCICDGYRAVRFSDESLIMPQAASEKNVSFDLSKCFNGLSERGKINLPDVSWVKSQKKIKTAELKAAGYKKREIIIKFVNSSGENVYFNIDYIIDIMEAIPYADTVTLGGAHDAIYLRNSSGEGIVLPVSIGKFNANRKNVQIIDGTIKD